MTATSRVLETLTYSDTYTVDAKTLARQESSQSPIIGFDLSPWSSSRPTGRASPTKMEVTGGLQPVYVSLLPDGEAATPLHGYAYLPSGSFEVKGHALHWPGQNIHFGNYVGAAHVTPTGLTVIYDETVNPIVDRWIYATIDASATKTLTVPVFETVEGVEVERGSATIRTRYLGGTYNIAGGFVALGSDRTYNLGTVEIWGDSQSADISTGTLNQGIPQEISVQYYHEITEETAEFETTETFALPELSLASR